MKITIGTSLYSFKEVYRITYLAVRSMKGFKYARKKDLLNDQFVERIMLAVTEVNNCEICSFAHTKMALEAGLSDVEIQSLLDGLSGDVPEDEMPAILFAQHYTNYRGRPSRKSWQRIVKVYGLRKAQGILGAIRLIMLGNTYGIPWSSFFNRFKGKPDKRSNLLYELGMMACISIFVPAAVFHTFISKFSRPS